jgi:hypothetical protein
MFETWACCIWSVGAAVAGARADPGCAKLLPFVAELAVAVSALLPLSKEEIASP